MPTDRRTYPPGGRRRRCRTALLACALLGAGQVSESARADIFMTTGQNGEEHFSDRPPANGTAIVVVTVGLPPDRNLFDKSAPMAGAIFAPTTLDSIAEDQRPPAQAEPFKPGGSIAAGKSFTAGD